MNVSVIIPLYFGKKNVPSLCKMLRNVIDCASKVGITVEVVFINDSPEEKIEKGLIEDIKHESVYIENMENKGIHYSRIRGLKESKGDFILFLDQDDLISPNYFNIQAEVIGEADVAVCLGCEWGKDISYCISPETFYKEEDKYNDAVNTYLGMELIRKRSIPDIWMDRIIYSNSADDVYLNLLLLHEKKKFVFVKKRLYCHVNTGKNTSLDYRRNIQSLDEVNDILKDEGIISKEEQERRCEWGKRWIEYNDNKSDAEIKNEYLMSVLDLWMRNIESGFSIERWLVEFGVRNVTIYGMGVLGKHLFDQLIKTQICIADIMDNKVIGYKDYKCKKMGEKIKESDIIIFTVFDKQSSVRDKLVNIYNVDLIAIEEILTSMVNFD